MVYDKGVSTRVCSVCGYTETVETEKLPTEKGVIKLLGATRIVFAETENIQYSLNGTDWQNSNVITGLDADTDYNIYVRRINNGILENIPTYNADINGDGVLNQSDTELIK